MNHPTQEGSSKVLLVEGLDDQYVVLNILDRFQKTLGFRIENRGGFDRLRQTIGAEIDVPRRRAVGIIADADTDIMARWKSITQQISDEGIQAPSQPDPAGTVINTYGKPRVGIWLMPDNESTGELEDFIVRMIPEEDPIWPLSQQYVDGIPSALRKFSDVKTLRAKLHAWLAVREDPRQMGLAIRARDLEVNGVLCQKFIAWLEKLYG